MTERENCPSPKNTVITSACEPSDTQHVPKTPQKARVQINSHYEFKLNGLT